MFLDFSVSKSFKLFPAFLVLKQWKGALNRIMPSLFGLLKNNDCGHYSKYRDNPRSDNVDVLFLLGYMPLITTVMHITDHTTMRVYALALTSICLFETDIG